MTVTAVLIVCLLFMMVVYALQGWRLNDYESRWNSVCQITGFQTWSDPKSVLSELRKMDALDGVLGDIVKELFASKGLGKAGKRQGIPKIPDSPDTRHAYPVPHGDDGKPLNAADVGTAFHLQRIAEVDDALRVRQVEDRFFRQDSSGKLTGFPVDEVLANVDFSSIEAKLIMAEVNRQKALEGLTDEDYDTALGKVPCQESQSP